MCPQVLFGKAVQLGLPVVKLAFLEVGESLNQAPGAGTETEQRLWSRDCSSSGSDQQATFLLPI